MIKATEHKEEDMKKYASRKLQKGSIKKKV